MKNFSNTINSHKSINSFNPSNLYKIINFRKNFIAPSRIKKDMPILFHRNKNSNSLKAQNIHYNLNNKNNNQKILENFDLSNDIKCQNNNSIYKGSMSSNNTNTNYYSKRRN